MFYQSTRISLGQVEREGGYHPHDYVNFQNPPLTMDLYTFPQGSGHGGDPPPFNAHGPTFACIVQTPSGIEPEQGLAQVYSSSPSMSLVPDNINGLYGAAVPWDALPHWELGEGTVGS